MIQIPLSLQIARRYIFSKKSTNAINIISYISMVGMGAGAMFLVIILSVFNGFEGLVNRMYSAFYPDIKITAIVGKSFDADTVLINKITALDNVLYTTRSLEENAYLKYEDRENIATIKGVENSFQKITGIDSFILFGKYEMNFRGNDGAILGAAVDEVINADMQEPIVKMQVMVPKNERKVYLNPEDAFHKGFVLPTGVFAIQQEFDEKFVLVPYSFVEELTESYDKATSIELKLKDYSKVNNTVKELKKILDKNLQIKNRLQQNASLFKVINTERLAVYVILSFVLFIVSFNIIGSLSMLVMDKDKDIAILRAMGASEQTIRNIFMLEGILSAMIGASIGLLLGFIICYIQKEFGLIKLQGSGSFVIQSYPVEIHALDFVLTFLIVLLISFIASIYPAYKASKRELSLKYG
jgi:lipoprotein-releasing system permease protein